MQSVKPVEKPGTDGIKALPGEPEILQRLPGCRALLRSCEAWGQAALQLQVFGAAGSRAVRTGQGRGPPTGGPTVSEVAALRLCDHIQAWRQKHPAEPWLQRGEGAF